MYQYRMAVKEDLMPIDRLVYNNWKGVFLPRVVIESYIALNYVAVAEESETKELVGAIMCNQQKRKSVVTVYDVVTSIAHRNKGIAKELLKKVILDSVKKNYTSMILKCPVTYPSNDFYRKLQFTHTGVQDGKKTNLNCYLLEFSAFRNLDRVWGITQDEEFYQVVCLPHLTFD